jgi:tetratricopeptide (TPR) repeat protein
MPLAPNPLFVGRGDELLQVAAALRGADTTVALGQIVASTGLGGLGKTQLAVEFVHRYGGFFAGGVCWLSFTSADEIPLQIAACAAPEFASRSLEERVTLVRELWQSPMPRLLVFDNCEEEGLLERWRPSSGGCRVLVTSRRPAWSPTLGVSALRLDLLPRSNSIELLRRYRTDLAPDDPCLDAIAHELGDLPLALHLAGSYLRVYQAEVTLDRYLSELRRSDVVQHASLLGAGLDDSPSPTRHVQGVAQTFALCLDRLDVDREVDRVARGLLARMACMAPGELVPRDLLVRTMEDVGPLLRADGLRRLMAIGLLEGEEDGGYRLHRLLVHYARQECLDVQAQPAVERALIRCGRAAGMRHLTGPALAAVIPHLLDLAGAAIRGSGDERRAADLCHAAGVVLHIAGDLSAAGPWHERALAIRERVLGTQHADSAQSLNDLAELFHARGELTAARPLLERTLAVREQVLGPDHPATAETLIALGNLLHRQGELVAALCFHERAPAIMERVLGPDHRDTAVSLSFLARLLWQQGHLVAARPLHERAVAILERVDGPDHPVTALTLHNLGVVVRDMGELAAARPLLARALTIWERAMGPDHSDTALGLHDLGVVLWYQGELAAARPLIERALAIRECQLGTIHPYTVASRRALAEMTGEGEVPAAGGGFTCVHHSTCNP